jgi:hypothetical protein
VKVLRPERFSEEKAITYECGENPLWHPTEKRVYWTDINTGRLFRYCPASGKHEQFYKGDVVVERYVRGKEIQVAVLDDQALGAIEVVPANEFYDYAAKYGVQSIPNIILFRGGEVVDSVIGARPKADLKKWIDANL